MARTSAAQQVATRRRLFEAAAAEFARAGLHGANINRISLEAGLAKGTVYNYFPSKEALFLAVIEEGCRGAADDAADEPDAPVRDRLVALLAADMAWVRAHEPFARVLLRETLTADPALYPRLVAAAQPFLDAVQRVLEDGVARGEVRDDVPTAQLALLFVGLDEIALVQHWGSGCQWPTLEEIPELVVGQFLDGARRRPTEEEP